MSDVNPDCKELTLDYEYKYIEVGGTQFKNYPEQDSLKCYNFERIVDAEIFGLEAPTQITLDEYMGAVTED